MSSSKSITRVVVLLAALCLVPVFWAGPAAAGSYPVYDAFPSPMNQSGQNQYHFLYADYNADGTLTANPVVLVATPSDVLARTSSASNYVFKQLSDTKTRTVSISLDGGKTTQTYQVYATVPKNATVSNAWANTAQYYDKPAKGSTTWADLWYNLTVQRPDAVENVPSKYKTADNALLLSQIWSDEGQDYDTLMAESQAIPASLNGGEAFSLAGLPVQVSDTYINAPGGTYTPYVKVAPLGGTDAAYYLPYLSNTTSTAPTGHDDITANVLWAFDCRLAYSTAIPNGPTPHLLANGWALDGGTVNQSPFFYKLNDDGGTDSGIDVLASSIYPFNYWLKLMSNQDMQIQQPGTSGNIYPFASYGDLMTAYANTLASYPFPDRSSWLTDGVFMPYQTMPGFQSNLMRWYTPWGDWDLSNNTSGLFVRSNGDVEVPVVSEKDPQVIPLVRQTWTNQNYTIVNLLDRPIPSTTDIYPGGEVYLPGNVFFPHTGGVMNLYDKYMIQDQVGYSPRAPDTWLALAGQTMEQAVGWDDANNTEPGGQANKPYMYAIYRTADDKLSFSWKSANSVPVARQTEDLTDQVYGATVWVDIGEGYTKLASFGASYQKRTLENTVVNGTNVCQWKTSSTYGAIVPSLTLFVDEATMSQYGLTPKAYKATSWDPTARGSIGFDNADAGWNYTTPQKNNGVDYYQFELAGGGLPSDAKVLITLE